jgi:putative DNA primase/helicase
MRDLAQWVVWRTEVRRGKKTKVPYNAKSGHMAKTDDPATWVSFDAAISAYQSGKRYDGVGFIFSEHDPYTGIDFDDCVTDGQVDADKQAMITGLGSYTEYSPSGTGAHVIVRAKLPGGGRKSKEHGIEMYDNRRFFTFTGHHLPGAPTDITDRQTELSSLYTEIFPEPTVTQTMRIEAVDIPYDDRDLLEHMFAAANGAAIKALWNGDASGHSDDDSAADLALCNHLAFWTGRDAERMDRLFRQSGRMRPKWERNARTGETYGSGTIARAIAACQTVYTGYRNGTVHGHTPPVQAQQFRMPPNTDKQGRQGRQAAAPPPPPEFSPLKYRAEDGGIMDAWLELHGADWIFVVGPDSWHRWNGTHWAEDKDLSIRHQVVDLMDRMNQLCAEIMRTAPEKIKRVSGKYADADLEIPPEAWQAIERIKTDAGIAKPLHNATKRTNGRLGSVETMSRAKSAVAVDRVNVSDALNMANGTLSLHAIELGAHDRADLFTYCLPYDYDPHATCPMWDKFISEVLVKEGTTETDWELVALFQELVGYSLTPHTKREAMAWMFGEGSNGKSVAIHIIEKLLGAMAMAIDFQGVGQPGNYDLADIPGKRVLLSTEAERNKSMAESYIKRIVTGDTIKARPIYGSPIEFQSTAKIWWAMNDKPIIRDTTDSMWRRMKLIPFYRKFIEGENADTELPAKLETELSGILNWAIAGLIRLTLNGKFTVAQASEDAKREYREEANPIAQWVNTMTVGTAHPATLQAALYKEYKEWALSQGEIVVTSTQFSKDLKRLKVQVARRNQGQMYHLALVDDPISHRL